MATLPIPSLVEVQTRLAAHYRTRFPTKAHDQDSYFGKKVRAKSMAFFGFMKLLATAYRNAVPSYDNSKEGAAAWGSAWGINSNNPTSRYGPNIAKPAAGGVGTATGTPGSTIADATDLVDSTGQVFFKTSGGKTVGAGGTVDINIIAVTPGRSGNIGPPNVLEFIVTPSGVQAQVTLTTALGGGEDAETTESVVTRTLEQARRPKRGGSAADFRRWAENYLTPQVIPGGLVKRAYEYSLRGGTGTVHVVIVGGGSGLSRLLTLAIATDVKNYSDTVRTTTSQLFVLLPDMTAPGKLISCAVQPNPARKFQFDTLEIGLLVVSVTDPTHIVINSNIATSVSPGSASLRAAIDAGRKPRLQIQAASSVLPVVVRATAYTNAANSEITLEEEPASAIAAADLVHAGSYVVLPVAQAILDHVDSLGPSRQSGYADPFDGWSDTLTVGAIEGIAMAAKDPSDSRAKLLANISLTTIDGLTAPAIARDVLVGGTPELLYVRKGGLVVLPG